jgi:hypothetical protein
MITKVVVLTDKKDRVISPSVNNPLFGHIKVKQTRLETDDDTGFVYKRDYYALVHGKLTTLECFGWKANEEVDGKVIVKESRIPFNINDPDRDLKVAGKSGVVCTTQGQPIYRKNFYTTKPGAEDSEPVPHDNEDEIKAVYQNQTSTHNELDV